MLYSYNQYIGRFTYYDDDSVMSNYGSTKVVIFTDLDS